MAKGRQTNFFKIKNLIKETVKSPFEGSGKPEALKYEYSGCWSRRINQVHRLIYKVSVVYIEIISCRYHYK